jgi:cytochrome b subunit of formate dehydrogenase
MYVNTSRCCNFRRKNLIKKNAENILKYKDFTQDIQRVWNVIVRVITVIMGVTGTILKSFRQYLSNISGKNEIKEL